MKVKKIIANVLLIVFFMTQFNFIAFMNPVNAEDTGEGDAHYKYYYAQLSAEAKEIYKAMCKMYEDGSLKNGNSNYDLIAHGTLINNNLVTKYRNGDNALIIAFETARDAFYLDYPEVFYINIEKYSIRITSDKIGYHVWLGTGNNDNYYIHGISSKEEVESAEAEYDVALEEIVSEANKKEKVEDKVKFVHDAVIASATYKFDDKCKSINKGHIRTPYGALVAKEAVCEGYSKAFKTALDKLEIPCILVRGAYKHSDSGKIENHMWNYVQIENEWYAVDATFDDYEGGSASNDYFLAGVNTMNEGHCADGIMSAPEFEFTYPELSGEDYGITKAYDYEGLTVNYGKVEGESGSEAVTGGKFILSYKGMGIQEAKENGYYFLVKYIFEDGTVSDWFYMESLRDYTELYVNGIITEREKDFIFMQFTSKYMEFAVSDVKYGEPIRDNQYYRGGEDHILAQTGSIENVYGSLKPQPNFRTASPYIGTKLSPGKKQHIKLTYNEKLQLQEGVTAPTLRVMLQREDDPETAIENSEVSNFHWDNNATIEFDFIPSDMWGDNSVIYNFYVDGVIGSWSGRKLRPAYYYVQETFGCTYSMKNSGHWRAYARPQLMDTSNVDISKWEFDDEITAEERETLKSVTDRMTLVVSEPNSAQEEQMSSLVEETGAKVLESKMYNINLVLCNKNVIKTASGDKVTVYLGFPDGYGPESAGVTFKAYHYIQNSGVIIGVEEIPCTITPYGLLIQCSSFSPYAVAAVKETEADLTHTKKSIAINIAENGKVIGSETGVVELSEGDSKNFTVKANAGYEIESLNVLGSEVGEAIGKDSYEVTVRYSDIKDKNVMILASFVAKTVVEAEEAREEAVVLNPIPIIEDDDIIEIPVIPSKPGKPVKPSDSDKPTITTPDIDIPREKIEKTDIDVSKYIFDAKNYADKNPDVKKAFGYDENALLYHYLQYGIKENREISRMVFDVSQYLELNSDLSEAYGDDYVSAYKHFMKYGVLEGRLTSYVFDPAYYLMKYSDLKEKYGNDYGKAIMHFVTYGIAEGRRGNVNFDVKYYLSKNEDLSEVYGKDYLKAIEHFLKWGMDEKRVTCEEFDVAKYKNQYKDLQKAYGSNWRNYYLHYIKYGASEGRKGM